MACCLLATSHHLNQCWLRCVLMRAISPQVLMIKICCVSSEITLLKSLPHLPATIELNNIKGKLYRIQMFCGWKWCGKMMLVAILTKFSNDNDLWRVQFYEHCAQEVFNPSPPSDTYRRQWNGPALVQVITCWQFGTKPLLEPMLAYCQLDSWE